MTRSFVKRYHKSIVWGIRLVIAAGALAAAGCSTPAKPAKADRPAPPPPDPWVLACADPLASAPALLSNGDLGVRLGRDGTGVDAKHEPLPFFVSDEYEASGEEKIRTLPNPLQMRWSGEPKGMEMAGATDYMQSLDMRTGVLSTQWRFVDSKGGASLIRNETVISPARRLLGQKWLFESERIMRSYLGAHFEGTVQRVQRGTWMGMFGPGDLPWAEANRRRPIPKDKPEDPVRSEFERVVWFGESSVAAPVSAPMMPSYDDLLAESREHWKKAWETDIEIDGPVEDQQAVRSFLFYLRSSLDPNGAIPGAPYGLSSDVYHGHVFWDADVWLFPALALLDPARASAIPKYRLEKMDAARRNFAEGRSWYERHAGPRPALPLSPTAGTNGKRSAAPLQYPWESSVSGLETTPEESKQEHHVTGSVAWSLGMAASLGLADPKKVGQAIGGAAAFYRWRASPGSNGELEIRNVVSVHEHHFGHNDLYTNLVAQWCVNGGTFAPNATVRAPKFKLPRDATTFLTYDGDDLTVYKQAAAMLAVYPLQYPQAEKESRAMLERFERKITPNGPAMTGAVHAICWARLGEPERAYDAWRESWKPYTEHPLMLFSEKPRREETYFLTGAAGCLQTVLYGFLGFRIDSQKEPGAVWSKPLLGGRTLSLKPRLPKAWKRVTLRNFTVLGKRYTVTATHGSVRVDPGD